MRDADKMRSGKVVSWDAKIFADEPPNSQRSNAEFNCVRVVVF